MKTFLILLALAALLAAPARAQQKAFQVFDPYDASFTSWPAVSPGAMPSAARVLAYSCTQATTVVLTDIAGNAITTSLPATSGIWTFLSFLPASFSVSGTNYCSFAAAY